MIKILLSLFLASNALAASSTSVTADKIQNSAHSKVFTVPNASGQISCINCTEVLANKTIDGASNTITNLQISSFNGGSGADAGSFWRGDGTWQTVAGAGTVTSVDMSVPSFLSVSGNPITGAGTLAVSLASTSQSYVLIGPTSGSGAPTQRALVAGDIPTLNQDTSGSAASFTGSLAGDVTGTQGATVVGKINGTSLAGLSTGILKNTTTTGVPSIAIAADFPTLNQNTSGSAASFTGSLVGDVTGTQGATVVGKINGTSLAGLSTGILKNTTTTGVPSIAVAGDFPTLNQNTTGTASNVTGVVALVNGGTGTAAGSANAAFNALSPMSASGDIIYGGASGAATRLAKGSDTQVLTLASGVPSWAAPAAAAGNYAVTSRTTTYSILTTDALVLCSAGAFTVTLPTAVGVTGKIYIIKKTDSSLTNIITIASTSSQTFDGNSSLTLNTDQEQYTLVSDGSNWIITDHRWNMSPSTSVATTVTAVTTNPTKPTTGGLIDQDSVVWWRDTAKTAIIEYRYNQHGSTGGATGSGNYLWLIPFTVDTTNVAVYTGSLSQSLSNNSIIGNGNTFDNGSASDAYLAAVLYDSTHFRMQRASLSGAFLYAGSTGMAFNASILTYWVRIRVPVSGWSP